MFSTMVLFLFHCDSQGFAAARMDVRAFSWQIIPALAMLNVCCSITFKMQVNILLVHYMYISQYNEHYHNGRQHT